MAPLAGYINSHFALLWQSLASRQKYSRMSTLLNRKLLFFPHENVSRHGSWDLINLNFSAQPLDEKMKQSGFGCYCSLLPEPESRRNFSRPVTCALDSRLEEDLSVCLFTSSLSFLLQLINKPELVTTNFSETVAVC